MVKTIDAEHDLSLSPCKMSVSLAEPLMSKHDYERWSSNLSIGDSHDDIDSKSYYIKLNSSTGCAISKALARKSMLWAKDSLERLPIKLTLENVGVITVFVALIMPKALTYALIYPIFRLVFGTLYPAYASYKAVRTKNVKEYVKWMMYWIVFALFTCAETFTDVFFSFWFPFYYEIKIILVLWLLSPATKGSSILYRRFVHPALCRREAEIDDALARATEQGYSAVLQLGTKGVNYATTVLMQTAIKNLPKVVPSGSLAASQSDPAISSSANHRALLSHSETDGMVAAMAQQQQQQQQQRRKARRRTKSEDVMSEPKVPIRRNIEIKTDSDDSLNFYEDLELNMVHSISDTTNESLELIEFKKPEEVKKQKKVRREDSVTRRKPRTRNQTARYIDSDYDD